MRQPDRVRGLGISCGLLVALAPQAAAAFECKTPEGRPQLSLRWPARVLEYGVRADSGLDPEVVRASFDAWNQPACSDLELRYVGLVAAADPVSQVRVVDAGWTDGRPADAVAITETSFRPSSGDIERAVIEVNQELYGFGDAEVSCAGGLYDLRAVITHEVGHFVGLGHTRAYAGLPTDPTMAPRVDACEVDKRSLEPDDVNGLCFLYPAGGPTGRCGGLPEQASYVSNTPFGCSSGPQGAEGALWGLLLGLAAAGSRRLRCPTLAVRFGPGDNRDPSGRIGHHGRHPRPGSGIVRPPSRTRARLYRRRGVDPARRVLR